MKPFFDKVFVRASHILIKLPPNPSLDQRNQALQQMQVWRQEILAGKVKFEKIHSVDAGEEGRERERRSPAGT